jgi:polysaccharide biosynthesis/export protein VpsN
MEKKGSMLSSSVCLMCFVLVTSCAQTPINITQSRNNNTTTLKKTEEIKNDQNIERTNPRRVTSDGKEKLDSYTLGVEDVLKIELLKPDKMVNQVTVAPDGTIAFPYIRTIFVKGKTIEYVQKEIQTRLANGYMKYPLVAVSLVASRSRKFFVYGEVIKPGAYPIAENMTALRAITMAGGFNRFGSASRVKVLRPKKAKSGFDLIKVDIKAVMEGDSREDLLLAQGDIVVVSEGMF